MGGVLLLFILSLVTGQDFLGLLTSDGTTGPAPGGGPVATSPAEEKTVEFVSFVLDENQNTWAQLLNGYQRAKLVLFRDATESGCGFAQSATVRRVHPTVMWAKFAALVEGARLASTELWNT